LDEECVEYVVVGDSREYSSTIDTDFDLVVAQESMADMPRLLHRFCSTEGIHLVQAIQHEQSAIYFVCVWGLPSEVNFFHPDICGDYIRLQKPLLTASELLSTRVRAGSDDTSDGGFYVPAPALGFIYYLLKKIDKGKLDGRHSSYLNTQWRLDPEGGYRQLRRYWSEVDSTMIARAAESNNWLAVQRALPELRRVLQRTRVLSPGQRWREAVRVLRRVWQPTGLFVAFLGVDGSGKSSVIQQVERVLAPAFRRTNRYHFRPHLLRRRADPARVGAPHGAPPRGMVASLGKTGFWAADYTLGYWLDVLPRLLRSSLVLFDRYYYDVMVDPRRYRYGGPAWITNLLGRIIPAPDVVVLLDTPADVAQARKQEVAVDEMVRQQKAYARLVRRVKVGLTIDGDAPLEVVVARTADAILGQLAARTAKRLGLPE
jgi:thymidylate kinase